MEVEPRFLERGDCQGNFARCTLTDTGCPLYGLLGREGKDGNRRVKGCMDPSARGKRNRTKGDSKARKARKDMNLAGVNSRHEELAGGLVRWEAKAGAQVGPMWTAYRKAEAQSEAQRPVGDNRPFVFTAAPDGISDQLISFRMSKMVDTVTALAEQLGIME